MGAKRPAGLGRMKDIPLPKPLAQFPTGKSLQDVILGGLKGEGLGFDPSFVGRTTSPVVAQREARFKEVERPELEAAMSARGLGRSTIATGQIGRAGAQVGRDVNQIIAEAFRAQEIQKAQDRARIQGLALSFTGGEAGQQAASIQEQARRLGVEIGAEQAQAISDKQTLNQLIATGSAIASGQPGQVSGIWAGGGGGAGTQTSDLQSLLDFLKKGQAKPFTGGTTPGGGTLASLAPGQAGGFGSQFGAF